MHYSTVIMPFWCCLIDHIMIYYGSMDKKIPISVCLVIYNEEIILERALLSVVEWADEILVVHDGECKDASLEICKKYGAAVYVRPHEGIAEPHRAWMYGVAQHDWILQLDADEYVSDGLARALPELIGASDVAVYELVWPNWDGTRYTTQGWPHKKALFNRKKIEFLALPHSEVLPFKGSLVQTPYVLEHRPAYDNVTWKMFRTKWLKWTKIHAAYMLRSPETYQRFPPNAKVTTPRYYVITRHPYLLAVPLAIYQGMQSILSGGYRAGIRGLKTSLFIGMYYLYMALEVAELKRIIETFSE